MTTDTRISNPRILITGGAGFIGSRLAAALSTAATVTVFDNFHPQVHDGNPENRDRLARHAITVIEGDIRDAAAVADAVARTRPQIIYHLAAETGTGQSFDLVTRYNDVNVMGTAYLIDAIRAHAPDLTRVVLAGSRSVYGEGACVDAEGRPTPAVERLDADLARGDFAPKDRAGRALTPVPTDATCVVAPASIYASTKLMQEYLLSQAFWGSDIAVGILRLQNVYGPGQSLNNPYTGVLSIFTRQIVEGKTLNIYEDGEITRDFVLVDDVVAAFAAMGLVPRMPREIIDIGSGEPATILDVARRLLGLLGVPQDRYTITGAYRPGDIRYAVADITRARDALGWQPSKSLGQGLEALVDWSSETMAVAGAGQEA
ncbi:NAD-dependent epimerase/dehydratase family protein [Aliiroseovarius sp.]|uniref:NAD-dependent epimerase/dehydratase family protein n=1 Tax=Aliiroseovarius sp. TaxID=1872442 RepID=UPI00262C887D|nr:NAD-dependent epimerase/dehydratase family protein [Aliiroseovarius sp.]